MSPIRYIAPSRGAIVAVAQLERSIQIWDIMKGEKVAEFDTVLEFGGRRLVIDNEGKFCVTAAYHVHGIAGYDVYGGLCWQHKNLKKAQILTVSRNGDYVFCGFDDKSCIMLEISSGREAAKFHGVRAVHESPFQPIRFLDKMKPEIARDDGTLLFNIGRLTFGFLTVAFAADSCCTSEAGGSVRCFDLNSTIERWRYIPSQGSHILRLGYSNRTGLYYGVEWPYQHGGNKKVLCFNPESGVSNFVCDLGQPSETEFCLEGDYLITSIGDLIDLSTGKIAQKLPFGDVAV